MGQILFKLPGGRYHQMSNTLPPVISKKEWKERTKTSFRQLAQDWEVEQYENIPVTDSTLFKEDLRDLLEKDF